MDDKRVWNIIKENRALRSQNEQLLKYIKIIQDAMQSLAYMIEKDDCYYCPCDERYCGLCEHKTDSPTCINCIVNHFIDRSKNSLGGAK